VIRIVDGRDRLPALRDQMREADMAEVLALGEPDEILRTTWHLTPEVWAAVDPEDRLLACFGVAPASVMAGVGHPWCLTTPEIERYRRMFILGSRMIVDWMRTQYRVLEGCVAAEYRAACRWLAWLGFELGPPFPVGSSAAFRMFRWEKA